MATSDPGESFLAVNKAGVFRLGSGLSPTVNYHGGLLLISEFVVLTTSTAFIHFLSYKSIIKYTPVPASDKSSALSKS